MGGRVGRDGQGGKAKGRGNWACNVGRAGGGGGSCGVTEGVNLLR